MTTVNRRQLLWLATGGLAALAGCSDAADDGESPDSETTIDGDGDLPSYASILPETDHESYFYGAIDVETMSAIIDDEGAEAGDEPTDPLIGNPIVVALLSSFGLGLLIDSRGAGSFSEHDDTPDGEAAFVYADGVYAIVGQYDYEGLTAALESDGYTSERTGDSYAIYSDADNGEVVGVTDEVYAFTYPNGDDPEFDPLAAVERTIETAIGQREPKHETDDEFERLLRLGDSSGITLGLYTDADEFAGSTLEDDQTDDDADGIEFSFDAFGGAYGVHQQLSVAGSGATANAIVTYSSEDRVDVDRLESSLGTEADSVDVTRDETVVSIEAEYAGDLS